MRAFFLMVVAACGAPAPVRRAPPEPLATAAPAASSAPSAAPEARRPPPLPARTLVVIESRDEVPEAIRASVPPTIDFGRQVLVGWLRPGQAVQIVAKPAILESRAGVLRVVGVVRHHPAPSRRCPGGIAPDPRLEMRPELGEGRVAGLSPNFLVAVDRARVRAARSLDVTYGEDVDDPPAVYDAPNKPCPAYP